MYVYTEVLSVSARRGTNKCESAQQALIYKRICDMKYDIWAYDIMKYLGFMMWEQLKIMDHCAEIMGWLHIGAILPLGLRELKSSAGKSQWKNHAGIQKHLWRHICGCLMVFLWIFVAGVDSLHG